MPKEFDIGLTVSLPVDNPYGGEYTLRLGDCTGLDDLEVRKKTGQTLVALMGELTEDAGMQIVVAAVVVWLTRRKTFPHVTFEDVARTITWGSDFDVRDADAETEEEAEGKAPASADSPKK